MVNHCSLLRSPISGRFSTSRIWNTLIASTIVKARPSRASMAHGSTANVHLRGEGAGRASGGEGAEPPPPPAAWAPRAHAEQDEDKLHDHEVPHVVVHPPVDGDGEAEGACGSRRVAVLLIKVEPLRLEEGAVLEGGVVRSRPVGGSHRRHAPERCRHYDHLRREVDNVPDRIAHPNRLADLEVVAPPHLRPIRGVSIACSPRGCLVVCAC